MTKNMYIAKTFKAFFYDSFHENMSEQNAQVMAESFIMDVIRFTPLKLKLVKSFSGVAQFDLIFLTLNDLKYLNEFSDDFFRYWCVTRAYSGALAKLKKNYSVKGSRKVYFFYFQKYGDRRPLRDDHWFEKRRWEFLDELQQIYSEHDLDEFVLKYQQILNEHLNTYSSFVTRFIKDLKRLNNDPVVKTMS